MKFCYSLCLSCFSFFNFYNLSLDCLYNFLTKFSSMLILETKNDINLFAKNENEKALCCLSVAKMHSSRFM